MFKNPIRQSLLHTATKALIVMSISILAVSCQSRGSGGAGSRPGMTAGHFLMGTVASFDPTGISGMALAKVRRKQQMDWLQGQVGGQFNGLSEADQQRVRMQMRQGGGAPMDAEAMNRELYEGYGVDENGNPR